MNNKKIIGLLLSASMVITAVVPAFAVTTNKTEEYNYGESITITRDGSTPAALEITSDKGVKVLWDSFKTGEKSKTFKIPADASLGWTEGTYTVKTGDETTTFKLAAKPTYSGAFSKWSDRSVTIAINGSCNISASFTNMPAGAKVRYKSDDTNVASVNGSKVTGLRTGTAYITAELVDTDGNVLADCGTNKMTVRVISNDGGGTSSNHHSGTTTGGITGSGMLAGGNISGTGAGIYQRPDSYSVGFQDLGEAAWATNAINSLAKKGVISGYSETTFAPNASITRAEFTKLISSLYGLVSESSIFPTQSFTDVPKDAWYFNYVEVCAQLGVVNGYGDGTFNPNALISRQEMAAIIYRTTNVMQNSLTPVNPAKTFADDADIYDYAKPAVSALQQAGLISGTSETTFEPQAGCTRAQAATIMYNLYEKYAK